VIGVLFVCTGNICRSPMAEGAFRHMVTQAGLADGIRADSAGIIAYHQGEAPDPRAREAVARRGYDLDGQTARQIGRRDFEAFDYAIALDSWHHDQLRALAPQDAPAPEDAPARVRRLLEFAPTYGTLDVPDPYYGDMADFERALDMIEAAAAGLLAAIRAEHL
jgi:protein-tyrosine phosphatase